MTKRAVDEAGSSTDISRWWLLVAAGIMILLVAGAVVVDWFVLEQRGESIATGVADEGEDDGADRGFDVSIFLCVEPRCPPPTADQLETLREALADDPDVSEVIFEDQAAAYARFQETYADDPDLLAAVGPDTLPPAFRLALSPRADAWVVADRYRHGPGIEDVTVVDAGEIEPTAGRQVPTGELSVYLCDGYSCPPITDGAREALRERLLADPDIAAVGFVSSEEAYERFAEIFADQPDLVDGITPETLPASFVLRLVDPDAADEVSARYEEAPGVDELLPTFVWVPDD